MALTRIAIQNFRSIRSTEFVLEPLTTLIGPNNCGKSNIFLALRWALDPSTSLAKADWPVPRDNGPPADSENVVVEVTFSPPFPRIIRRIGYSNGRTQYQVKTRTPVEERLKKARLPRVRDDLQTVPYGERYREQGKIDRAKISAIRDEFLLERESEIEWVEEWEDLDSMPQDLPLVLLIPAVRDLSDLTGERSKSEFRRILAHRLKRHLESHQAVQDAVATLQGAFASLNALAATDEGSPLPTIQQELAQGMSDWNVQFRVDVGTLSPPDLSSFIEPATSLFVDDGTLTSPSAKGHGLQRAMLLELVRFEARVASSNASTSQHQVLLLVEEPEIYLHPQKQRLQARRLREIASSPGHQVLVTTHSPYFVDLTDPRRIVTVAKSEQHETSTRQTSKNLFVGDDTKKQAFNLAYWFSQGRAEMLFARRVAFVEGPTEMALFPLLAEKLGVFNEDVTLIDCASKDNLPLYCEVGDLFGLDFIVVHDEDPVPEALAALAAADFTSLCCDAQRERKRSEHRTKSRSTATNAAIKQAANGRPVIVFSPDLEAASGISRAQGQKKSKQLAAVEKFQDTAPADIPEQLKNAVLAIYAPKIGPIDKDG